MVHPWITYRNRGLDGHVTLDAGLDAGTGLNAKDGRGNSRGDLFARISKYTVQLRDKIKLTVVVVDTVVVTSISLSEAADTVVVKTVMGISLSGAADTKVVNVTVERMTGI